MKQQDYLDAMGISRWRLRSGEPRSLLLCDNPRVVDGHPLVAAVLRVMDLDIDNCHVAERQQAGDEVIWDMRLMNRPHKPGILYSSPLNKLLEGSEGKRALWQQICKLNDAGHASAGDEA